MDFFFREALLVQQCQLRENRVAHKWTQVTHFRDVVHQWFLRRSHTWSLCQSHEIGFMQLVFSRSRVYSYNTTRRYGNTKLMLQSKHLTVVDPFDDDRTKVAHVEEDE